VWATDQVGWAHCQVGESSGGPNPLVRDGHEPGWCGPLGTHVSQAPERCVGAATLEGHDEVLKLSTGQIVCTSVQKERETNQLSSRPVCSLAE
jgi:hypothetical protein